MRWTGHTWPRYGWSAAVVQSFSCAPFFAISWTAAHQASLSITNSQSLLKLMSITWVMPSNHLILCRSLLLLPSIFPSIRVFPNDSALCVRWPKYWSFSIYPSNEYSGMIFFRTDKFDLLAVQGTLKSLFQHHSLKASVLHWICTKKEEGVWDTGGSFILNILNLLTGAWYFQILSLAKHGDICQNIRNMAKVKDV